MSGNKNTDSSIDPVRIQGVAPNVPCGVHTVVHSGMKPQYPALYY